MAFMKHSFENGTNGAAITPSSSAGTGVTTLSLVSVGSGSTFTFDNTRAAHGTLSAKITPAAAVSTLGQYTMSTTGMAWRGYFYLTAITGDDIYIARLEGAGTTTRILSMHLDFAGKMVIRDASAGNLYTSTTAVPLNTWVRFELYGVVGNTTTNGVIKAAMYTADGTTPIDSVFSTTTANLNGTGFSLVQFGKCNTSNYATAFWMDDILVNTSATDLIGPYTANLPPSVTAGADISVVKNTVANLTSTASDADGTIASYAWTFDSLPAGATTPTLTNGTTANASFTAAVAGVYTARITVTDDVGATAFDTMTVSVPSTSLRPGSVVSNPGSWTNVGGAGDAALATADELDATYAQSPAAPANAVTTFALSGTLESGLITVKVRADIDTAVAGTLVVDLMQSTTLIATRTFSLSTTKTDFSYTLTSGENAAVTDRSALRIRVTANQT